MSAPGRPALMPAGPPGGGPLQHVTSGHTSAAHQQTGVQAAMQAIELETEIDENQEIHIKLPADVRAREARVVVLYEQPAADLSEQVPKHRPVKLGLFPGTVWMSDDFDDPLPDDFWLGGNP